MGCWPHRQYLYLSCSTNHSSLMTNTDSLCKVYVFVHSSDFWIVPMFRLLGIMLIRCSCVRFCAESCFYISYVFKVIDHMITPCSIFRGIFNLFFKATASFLHSYQMSAVCRGSNFSVFPTILLLWLPSRWMGGNISLQF